MATHGGRDAFDVMDMSVGGKRRQSFAAGERKARGVFMRFEVRVGRGDMVVWGANGTLSTRTDAGAGGRRIGVPIHFSSNGCPCNSLVLLRGTAFQVRGGGSGCLCGPWGSFNDCR